MILPIPIGTRHIATVHGEAWKIVRCEGCGVTYGYRMSVQASASSLSLLSLDNEGARRQAAWEAEQQLQKEAQRVMAAVPCPECGTYQKDMIPIVNGRPIHLLQIVGAIILACAPAILVMEIPWGWGVASLVALLGITLIIRGIQIKSQINPNAGDPEPRKRLGQSLAVSGEKLAELLKNADA